MTKTATQPIETLFCATDFSDTAELALRQAVRFARRHGARLVLAHVIEGRPASPIPLVASAEEAVPIRDLVLARLEEASAPLRAEGVRVDLRVEMGAPGPELVAAAEAEAADLVVIGTRGLTGLAHLVTGSTAEHVVRRCPRPVLTVHPGDAVIGERIETVLVPTDLSGNATAAADAFLALFAGVEQPRILFVYADETPPYFEPFKHETLARVHARDEIREAIEARMQPTVEALTDAGFAVETRVLDGNPVEVVTAQAAQEHVDLILMSTHGRGAVLNTLFGRTAQRIVQHAPCPVLSIRPAAHPVPE